MNRHSPGSAWAKRCAYVKNAGSGLRAPAWCEVTRWSKCGEHVGESARVASEVGIDVFDASTRRYCGFRCGIRSQTSGLRQKMSQKRGEELVVGAGQPAVEQDLADVLRR